MLVLEIIGGILLLLMLLLLVPVRVQASSEPIGKKGRLLVKYGVLCFDIEAILAKPKKPKKEPSPKKKAAQKAAVKKEKTVFQKIAEFKSTVNTVLDLIGAAAGPLKMIVRHIVLQKFYLRMVILKGDAQSTGEEYGKMNAYLGGVFAFLRNVIKVKKVRLDLYPDFTRDGDTDEGEFFLDAALSLVPMVVVGAGLWALGCFLLKTVRRSMAEPAAPPAPPKPRPVPKAGQSSKNEVKQ